MNGGYTPRAHRVAEFGQAVELANRLAAGSGIRRRVIRWAGSWLIVEAYR